MLNSKLYFFFPPPPPPPVPYASLHISFHSVLFIITFILYWSSLPCLSRLLTALYASVCHADIFGCKRFLTDKRNTCSGGNVERVCVCVCALSFSCFVEQYATHHKWTLICLTVLILPYDPGLDHLEERKWSFEVRSSTDPAKHWHI